MSRAVLGLLLLCLLPLSGCAINDALASGPRAMETIAGGVQVIASDILNDVNFQNAAADASGKVSDPRFTVDTFVGTGVRMIVNARLVGADLDFGVDAWGDAAENIDPDRVAELVALWQSGQITQEEFKLRWAELIVGAFRPAPRPAPAPPTPVPDTPIE